MRCENPTCRAELRDTDDVCERCGMLVALHEGELVLRGDESDDEVRALMRGACPVCQRAGRKHRTN